MARRNWRAIVVPESSHPMIYLLVQLIRVHRWQRAENAAIFTK